MTWADIERMYERSEAQLRKKIKMASILYVEGGGRTVASDNPIAPTDPTIPPSAQKSIDSVRIGAMVRYFDRKSGYSARGEVVGKGLTGITVLHGGFGKRVNWECVIG